MIRLVVNCASTWANQIAGSDGQNGGNLTETFATAVVASAATAGGSVSVIEFVNRRGHQCKGGLLDLTYKLFLS